MITKRTFWHENKRNSHSRHRQVRMRWKAQSDTAKGQPRPCPALARCLGLPRGFHRHRYGARTSLHHKHPHIKLSRVVNANGASQKDKVKSKIQTGRTERQRKSKNTNWTYVLARCQTRRESTLQGHRFLCPKVHRNPNHVCFALKP